MSKTQIVKEFDAGVPMSEDKIKKGLRELNSSIHFDVGGRKDIYHPNIENWQGIFYNLKHLGAMDRGVVPEYTVWHVNKRGEVTQIDKIGWRLTFENLVRHRIPNITWETLCQKFGVEYKEFKGLFAGDKPAEVA